MIDSTKDIIEIMMGCIMLAVIIGVLIRSLRKTGIAGKPSGIGARVIQFTCVSLIIPGIIILGIEDILKGETIATIIGGLIGYVLSGVGNYESTDNKNNQS